MSNDTPNEIARSALRRILVAAHAIERGEEDRVEAAQSIIKMAWNGLEGRKVYEWTHIDRTLKQPENKQ